MRVALLGAGYWGMNLLRVFGENPGIDLAWVVEPNPALHDAIAARSPRPRRTADYAEALADPALEAVVVATPVATHHELASQALDHCCHVLVEKPLAASAAEAADLVARARIARRALMVDHTFLFHPVVQHLAGMLDRGALGTVSYYDSQRINLGLFQPDVNVLWDLAPHDLAIIDSLFGAAPVHVEASGHCHVNPMLPDLAFVTLHYATGMVAHLNLSWMSPVKLRRVAVGGDARMAVWDDLDRGERLKIHDCGIRVQPQDRRGVVMPDYRLGDVASPRLRNNEPLADIVEHFRLVCTGQATSRMPGEQGLRVVRTLERAQSALTDSLHTVRARRCAPATVAAE